MINYYILDTETDGLLPKMHSIIEYSIIRCSDRVQLTRQLKSLYPRNASADALKITGKTINDLYKGIGQEEAIADFEAFIEQDGCQPNARCLVCHNVSFDRRFLHALWERHKKRFPFDLFMDTVPFAKRLATKQGHVKPKVKLEMAMDLFGLKKFAGAHTASGDTRNTYVLWKHLMDSGIDYLDLIKQVPHFVAGQIPSDEDIDDVMSEFE